MTDFDRVEARGLVKTYGATRALAGVDVDLRAGAVTVIEGPNGAGKSTLLGILTLEIRPTRGTLRFGERDALEDRDALRGRIGVLSHASFCYPDLTGAENLALAARLAGVTDASPRVKALRERFEIGAFGERPLRTYSRGQVQRVALARALVHAPRMVVLDEPSTGLDPHATELLVESVREEKARGAMVAIVTHDEAFGRAVADVTVRIVSGRVEKPS